MSASGIVQLSESGSEPSLCHAPVRTSNNQHQTLQLQRLSHSPSTRLIADYHRDSFINMVVVSDYFTRDNLHRVEGHGKIAQSQGLDFLNQFTVGEYVAQRYARPGRHTKHVQYDVEYSDHSSEVSDEWDETMKEFTARWLQKISAIGVIFNQYVQGR
jgi:hypothetical protein